MSRVGKAPIPIPQKVKAQVLGGLLEVEGPKGKNSLPLPKGISGEVKDGRLLFSRRDDSNEQRALHGLARALAANAVQGVVEGFRKELTIVGIGYRAAVAGGAVTFNVGYSHTVVFPMPPGILIVVEENTRIVVTGVDKQKVGQTAAEIRGIRPPDPYKGKGIRYKDEILKLKVGKAGATG